MSDQAYHTMTAEPFLAWQMRQDRLYELVDGQPVADFFVKRQPGQTGRT